MTEHELSAVRRIDLFKRLVYVYIGTSHYDADRDFYKDVLGARLVWEFKEFGARVAAFDLCGEPYLLLADHVKAPSKRLIYQVDDLDAAAMERTTRSARRFPSSRPSPAKKWFGKKSATREIELPCGSNPNRNCFSFRPVGSRLLTLLQRRTPCDF